MPDYVGNHNGVTDDFASFSGTSMAAPYVAGASVLLREAMQFVGYTNITQNTIYNHMMSTADTFFDSATGQNYKRLNLNSAHQRADADRRLRLDGGHRAQPGHAQRHQRNQRPDRHAERRRLLPLHRRGKRHRDVHGHDNARPGAGLDGQRRRRERPARQDVHVPRRGRPIVHVWIVDQRRHRLLRSGDRKPNSVGIATHRSGIIASYGVVAD